MIGLSEEPKESPKIKYIYCDGCKWCWEDSLSCESDWYNSCHNEKSENYLYREDDLNFTYPGEECKDKEIETPTSETNTCDTARFGM